MLRRADYGDQSTTYLLKGLELVSRFRFMFLESDSDFSSQNILASNIDRVPELANRLLKEMNLLRKDAREAGMDEPRVWRNYVTWDHILAMSAAYRPRELKLRDIICKIGAVKGQPAALAPLREELAGVLEQMEKAIRPENSLLLQEMARKLGDLVKDDAPCPPLTPSSLST